MSDNGEHVTRAELTVHIRRIDENLSHIADRLERLENRWTSARLWLTGRATSVIDRFVPLAAVAAVTYLIAH